MIFERTTSWFAVLVSAAMLVALVGRAQAVNNELYLMSNNGNDEDLYIISFDDPINPATSPITLSSAIDMDTQSDQDYRDIHVLRDGSLVVESATGGRLSYWSAEGVFDSVAGIFGENSSSGLTPMFDGSFLSSRFGSGTVRVYQSGQTTIDYTLTLQDNTNTTLGGGHTTGEWAAARDADGSYNGGIIVKESSSQAYVFSDTGGPGDSTITAAVSGNPQTGNTTFIAPLPGGWAGIHGGNRWYAYSDTLNGSSQFPGTAVFGTVGGAAEDIASFGLNFTAALFRSTTLGGNSAIQIWDNNDLAGGPIRTIDLGFNLSGSSLNKLAGPMVLPEPTAAMMLVVGAGVMFVRRRRGRGRGQGRGRGRRLN